MKKNERRKEETGVKELRSDFLGASFGLVARIQKEGMDFEGLMEGLIERLKVIF